MKRKNLEIKEMKQLAKQIIQEELKDKNIICDVFPLTFLEYYCDFLPHQKYHLMKSVSFATVPFSSTLAFCQPKEKYIVIFLSKVNQLKKIEPKIFNLVFLCYHEVRHLEQDWVPIENFYGFLHEIEATIAKSYLAYDYYLNHDQYSYEIGANLYAVKKTEEYLKKNYPNIYLEHQLELQEKKERYEYDYFSYNPMDTFDRYVEVSRRIYHEAMFSLNKNKSIPKRNRVDEIFFTPDYQYKSLAEIRTNQAFCQLEKEIIYTILTSSTFLSSLDFDTLDKDDTELLYQALEYAYWFYHNQQVSLEKKKVGGNVDSSEENKNITKFKQVENHLDLLFLNNFNYLRNEKRIQNNQDLITNSRKKIKRKEDVSNKGFFLFDWFYVVAIVLTLFSFLSYFLK